MKYLTCFFFCCSCFLSKAQLYVDASDRLPASLGQISSMDVRAADIDNDGDLDLILANEFQANRLLVNDGTGTFTLGSNVFLNQDKDSEDVAVADFNNDGNLDVVFCSEDDYKIGRRNVHEYQWGMGDGTFRVSPYQLPDSEANAVVEAWINDDGFPDLIFGNNGTNTILINQGDGRFVDESDLRWASINRTTQDIQLADVNGDGLLDIFEGNENGNLLWLNRGGTYENVSTSHLPLHSEMETRKADFGDIDGDGDLDVFLSNVNFLPGKNNANALWINDGNGVFIDESAQRLSLDQFDTLDGLIEDIDGDGDKDLLLANVNLQSRAVQQVFENKGNGEFIEQTDRWLPDRYFGDMLGVIFEDLNGDGLKDIYWCNRGGMDVFLLGKKTTAIEPGLTAESILIHGNDSVVLKGGPFSHLIITDLQGRPFHRVRCTDEQCRLNQTLPAGHYVVLGYRENELLYRSVHALVSP